MRIISGIHRGRKLQTPSDDAIRPTSDRMREAIFNIIAHGEYADRLVNGHVLDSCCGTGALGLEALSRGAAYCTFIDSSAEAIALTEHNCALLKAPDYCRFLKVSAAGLMQGNRDISLVLFDPPYGDADIVAKTLTALHNKQWLAEGALLCIEQPAGRALEITAPYALIKEKKYGKSKLWVLEYSST